MKTNQSTSLLPYNSFSIEAHSDSFYQPATFEELTQVCHNLSAPFYILGEGSNTLFVDEVMPVTIQPAFKGVEIVEHETFFELKVAAGENWHQLVEYTLSEGIYGLENLALIPGSVGAAPVQNIGAYGVEFSKFCHSVLWFDFLQKKQSHLSRDDCQFSYRDSIFKNELKDQGIITHVILHIPKAWQANLSYSGLSQLSQNASAEEVFKRVIAIRQAKLPDPKHLPNAGSFFKNPVISAECYQRILQEYTNVPHYSADNDMIKLAAGWLIEQCGLKGYKYKNVGIHEKQALVIVNYGASSGNEIIELAGHIQDSVQSRFNITLQPEVRFINRTGEVTLEELRANG